MRYFSFINNKIQTYLLTVSLFGIILFFLQIKVELDFISTNLLLFLLIACAVILLNVHTIPLPPKGNSLSMDSAIYLATIFIYGLDLALYILIFSALLYIILERKIVWWKHFFNFSIYVLMILGAHYSFLVLGGEIGLINTSNIAPYIFSLAIYCFINILLIGMYFFLMAPEHFWLEIRDIGKDATANYIITLSSALILGLLFEKDAIFGLVIFTIIILLVSRGFKKYFHIYEEISKDKTYREQILNSLPVGIITVDDVSSNFSLNTAASNLMDLKEDEVKKLAAQEENLLFNKQFWDILSSKKICQNVKVKYIKEELTHHLLVSQSTLLDQNQQLIGRIFYFVDITETEELEKRMHQSEKLAVLGELAAGAAHEIRNPLAVIHGFLSLMKQSFSEEDKMKYQIPLMLKEFDRINAIIEEMLLMAKPGAPVLQEIAVEDIVKEIPYGQDVSPDSKLRVDVKMDIERVPLLLDPKQIKQVLYNLFRNSSEAMGGRGTISLYSKTTENSYQLFIKDSGSGIQPEMKKTLFHPFSTSKDTGTGLGLTIVQRIIENHGGKIEVQETSNKGTTFLITLPLGS